MFGVLASGRLVNTNVQQVGENTFLLGLDSAENINHVVVFLTGQLPFSDGFGGSIFFGWPSDTSGATTTPTTGMEGVSWQYLGYITNEKPSAIFKISKVKPKELIQSPFNQDVMMVDASTVIGTSATHNALIGISVEPLAEIAQKTTSTDTQASTVDSFTEFSQKMLENFFNYASSFAVDQTQLKPSEGYIPVSVLQQWYGNFQRRLQANPNFWKSM